MLRLADILMAMRKILGFTKEGQAAFLFSPVTQDAVVRNLEVIGEAAGRVCGPLRDAHPEVPWNGMKGFASFAKHEHWKVNIARVWAAVEQIPELESKITGIRADTGDGVRPR
jgi:uncharacterized protein with HEPN domain